MTTPIRIAVLHFAHETVTFLKDDTTVALAKAALAEGRTPVVPRRSQRSLRLRHMALARDHRPGPLRHAHRHDHRCAYAEPLRTQGVKAGDDFDMAVGGLADESAGEPVRIQGKVLSVGEGFHKGAGQLWVNIAFGRGNVLVISPYLTQIVEPSWFRPLGLDPADFKVFAIKSRVHFRRGFDDSGLAKTILLVEPPEPFLGTVHLEALDYKAIDIKSYYPYGNPVFP